MPIKKTTSKEFPLDNLNTNSTYAIQSRSYSGSSYSEWSPLQTFKTAGKLPHIILSSSEITTTNLPVEDINTVENFNQYWSDTYNRWVVSAVFDWDNSVRQVLLGWIFDIIQFGYNSVTNKNNQIKDGSYAFYRVTNTGSAISNLDTSNITDMSSMFLEASYIDNISLWDTSNVTNMSFMFNYATDFNQPINNWNTSNVTDMSFMFRNASSFNQNIGQWNTSNVINMSSMFRAATSFNQHLSGWCVTNIPTKPSNFDYQATSWTYTRPVWGTCP